MDDRNLLIDAVLDTYPLSPTPPNFTARVMAGVRSAPKHPQPKPTFRLDFMDYVLPVFFALFSAGMVVLNLVAVLSLDKLTRIKLELQAKILLIKLMALPGQLSTYTFPMDAWLPAMVIGMTGLFAVMVVVGIWSIQRPLHLVEK